MQRLQKLRVVYLCRFPMVSICRFTLVYLCRFRVVYICRFQVVWSCRFQVVHIMPIPDSVILDKYRLFALHVVKIFQKNYFF